MLTRSPKTTASSVDLSVNFTNAPPPEIEIIHLTPTSGYIQSPSWDGTNGYPSFFDGWKELVVPPNCSVMISVIAMEIEGVEYCDYDRLTITIGNNQIKAIGNCTTAQKNYTTAVENYTRALENSTAIKDCALANQTTKLTHCDDVPVLKTSVFNTNVLKFNMTTDEDLEYSGFRLYFSFHQNNEVPQQLDNGKWNCSVPFWPQFQKHLLCNMAYECLNGEDEKDCGQDSPSCGQGLLSIGSRCYIFIPGEERVTWNEAAQECLRRDAYLASFNSPEEWTGVIDVLGEMVKEPAYVGLQTTGPAFPTGYRKWYQWNDGSVVLYANFRGSTAKTNANCAVLRQKMNSPEKEFLDLEECHDKLTSSILCEKDTKLKNTPGVQQELIPRQQWKGDSEKYVACPLGHFTHKFLACDLLTRCWAGDGDVSAATCAFQPTPPPPSMSCMNGVKHIPYSLVCDHRADCGDNSDENLCVFPSCRLSGKFECANKQCLEPTQQCDSVVQCVDGSDERLCPGFQAAKLELPKPPAIINFNKDVVKESFSYGIKAYSVDANQSESSSTGVCPETHFLCPGPLTYCMPVYVRCNGVYDCPGRQDEDGCDGYRCPGYYRCRASPVCLHASQLCDGVFQCPQQDDELLCQATCPHNCTCYGLAFYCQGPFPAQQYPELRFLHAPETGLSPQELETNSMLIYLSLAKCGLKDFDNVEFPNLRILDLSNNDLSLLSTTQLTRMIHLQKLSLAGNPLQFLFGTGHDPLLNFPELESLDLSNVILPELNVTDLTIFPRLKLLNLTGCGIERVTGKGFRLLEFLKYLDLRSCPMKEFPRSIFEGLKLLKEVWADSYKLCCPATLPEDFSLPNCHSPSDEISSCDALLRSDFYRIVLSIFAALALIGNLSSFVYRVFINPASSHLGFGIFVTHLCVSDFLMGVYLAVIGIADRMYQGNYLWKDDEWKQSAACKVAGFLSLLSNEVSAFIICLITLDRFIVLRFPFTNIYFRKKSAHVACLIVWFIGIVLAGIPLMPSTAHWHFYDQNGICIPLPITRNDFAGHDYSFGIIIVFNFLLFLLIAAGQVFIYWSIHVNTMSAGDSNKKSNDITIARRLITIAMSDFLCWFPIGLLGLMSSNGVPVPGEVNVAMSIIVLPINSAINPFLYTINSLMEKRRKDRMQKLQKMMMSSFASKSADTAVVRVDDSYGQAAAMRLINTWLARGLFSPQNLDKIALNIQERQSAVECQHEV
ncbi:hypothetical protein ACOMHN_025795 [Nucella lapillus]